MAKNTNNKNSYYYNDIWHRHNTSTGQFSNAKRKGGTFKGVRKENSDTFDAFMGAIFFVGVPFIIIVVLFLWIGNAI